MPTILIHNFTAGPPAGGDLVTRELGWDDTNHDLYGSDGTDVYLIGGSSLGSTYLETDGGNADSYINLTGFGIGTTGVITAGELGIRATADHTLSDDSDDFVIKNENEDKDIEFSLNIGGVQTVMVTLVGATGIIDLGTHALTTTGTISAHGYHVNIVAKIAAYTATAADDVITCGAGNETFTVDLPAVITGKTFHVKNVGTGTITVDADTTGGTTIDGATTKTLSQYESIALVSDASAYWII